MRKSLLAARSRMLRFRRTSPVRFTTSDSRAPLEAKSRADEILSLSATWTTDQQEALQYVIAANVDCLIDRLPEATPVLERLAAEAQRPAVRAGALRRLADIDLSLGDIDRAEARTRAAEVAASACGSRQRLYLLITRSELLSARGDSRAASGIAGYAHRTALVHGNAIWQAHSLLCSARRESGPTRDELLARAKIEYTSIGHVWGVLTAEWEGRDLDESSKLGLAQRARSAGLLTLPVARSTRTSTRRPSGPSRQA